MLGETAGDGGRVARGQSLEVLLQHDRGFGAGLTDSG
jgi:hypothetical protein